MNALHLIWIIPLSVAFGISQQSWLKYQNEVKMEFIYNRTSESVKNSIEIRKEKISKGIALMENDLLTLSMGAITKEDINRIQLNIFNIGIELQNMGYYFQSQIESKIYDKNDIFYQEDLQNWCNLVDKFKKAFFSYADTPIKPLARYSFEEFNKLEKILFDLNNRIGEVKNLYRECGNYECGEDNGWFYRQNGR